MSIKRISNLPRVDSEEGRKLKAATNEDGTVDIAKLFDAPEEQSEGDLTVAYEAVKNHRGMSDEELYRKEYLLKAMHTLTLHGASTQQMASNLRIPISEVRALQKEMNARVIAAARKMDKHEIAGKTIMFYDHMIAEAMKMSTKLKIDENQTDQRKVNSVIRTKVEVLKLGLQAQTDKQRFLTAAGFWNNGLGDGAQEDGYSEGANDLRDIIDTVLSGDTFEMSSVGKDDEDDITLF